MYCMYCGNEATTLSLWRKFTIRGVVYNAAHCLECQALIDTVLDFCETFLQLIALGNCKEDLADLMIQSRKGMEQVKHLHVENVLEKYKVEKMSQVLNKALVLPNSQIVEEKKNCFFSVAEKAD